LTPIHHTQWAPECGNDWGSEQRLHANAGISIGRGGLSPTPMHFSQRAVWNRKGMQTGSELNIGDAKEYEGEENMQFNLNRSFNFNT
jgi:hypothetical protein